MCWQPHLTWRHVTHMSYHWLLRFDSGDVFLVCRNDTVSSEKREKTVALSKGVENVFFLAFFVCLLVLGLTCWWCLLLVEVLASPPQPGIWWRTKDRGPPLWTSSSGWFLWGENQNGCKWRSKQETRVESVVWSDSLPSTFVSISCSSSASFCRASGVTWGAPGKQTMMMLMLSRLPCGGRQSTDRSEFDVFTQTDFYSITFQREIMYLCIMYCNYVYFIISCF